MADVTVTKEPKVVTPKVTIGSIYTTLEYPDQLIVNALHGDNMNELVDKDTFMKKLATLKSKEVK